LNSRDLAMDPLDPAKHLATNLIFHFEYIYPV
jgi:hypothetical protein